MSSYASGKQLADPECHLLTLTGPGGIGKSRIAIELARRQRMAFMDGVTYIPLSRVAEPSYLASTIADELSLPQGRNPEKQLLDALSGQERLLILDNFEHLLAGASLLSDIIRVAPRVKLLITSRERINLQSEWLYTIEGLTLPTGDPQQIRKNSAVQLFVNSASRVKPGFEPDSDELAAIVESCQLVAGLPLGIELAAAWIQLLSCQEIAAEIARNLDFLASRSRDLPVRHRSIQAVFDYSWQLLDSIERRIVRKLALFPGIFDREAAFEVTQARLASLLTLVDKSFLRQQEGNWFDLHPLLRQYALEQLEAEKDEFGAAQHQHAYYFADFLTKRLDALQSGKQGSASQEIATQIESVRQATQWLLKQATPTELRTILQPLHRFYYQRGRFLEGSRVFGGAVKTLVERFGPDCYTAPETAILLGSLQAQYGWYEYHLGDYKAAEEALNLSMTTLRSLDTNKELAATLGMLGILRHRNGKYDQAEAHLEESYKIRSELGEQRSAGYTLSNLGSLAATRGQYDKAMELYERSAAIIRGFDDKHVLANILNNIGEAARALGQLDAARDNYQQSLDLRQEIGDQYGIATSLHNLGVAAFIEENFSEARATLTQSLVIFRQLQSQRGITYATGNLGTVFLKMGKLESAHAFLAESIQVAAEINLLETAHEMLFRFAELWCEEEKQGLAIPLLQYVVQTAGTAEEIRLQAEKLLVALLAGDNVATPEQLMGQSLTEVAEFILVTHKKKGG